jgi:hypothetical protein
MRKLILLWLLLIAGCGSSGESPTAAPGSGASSTNLSSGSGAASVRLLSATFDQGSINMRLTQLGRSVSGRGMLTLGGVTSVVLVGGVARNDKLTLRAVSTGGSARTLRLEGLANGNGVFYDDIRGVSGPMVFRESTPSPNLIGSQPTRISGSLQFPEIGKVLAISVGASDSGLSQIDGGWNLFQNDRALPPGGPIVGAFYVNESSSRLRFFSDNEYTKLLWDIDLISPARTEPDVHQTKDITVESPGFLGTFANATTTCHLDLVFNFGDPL